ncbi:hypothetical protein SAMN05443574_102420 [Haloarcula vallismortis]|uniref:Uncharacterized protein n=1 Tax=Haloarcula vallismortis TaxID=28442 RepID=A0A1H2SKY7_HALVA|nr:hypothetical protein [Haloarcula vallismortis]SDW32363.1 hypothetical protein SAMN05443574_102420 [Haloarcula vallismortis]
MSKVASTGATVFVCPFCERTFDQPQSVCRNCDSTVVVPLEDQSVYDSILQMCGTQRL